MLQIDMFDVTFDLCVELISILHVWFVKLPRSENRLANKLAKRALSTSSSFIWWDKSRNSILIIIDKYLRVKKFINICVNLHFFLNHSNLL